MRSKPISILLALSVMLAMSSGIVSAVTPTTDEAKQTAVSAPVSSGPDTLEVDLNSTCNPGRAGSGSTFGYWNETSTGSTNITAVAGQFQKMHPYVDSVSGEGSSTWVMLRTLSGDQYIQAGFRSTIGFGGATFHDDFVQVGYAGSGFNTWPHIPPANPDTFVDWQIVTTATNTFAVYRNGILFWGPTNLGWTPKKASVATELHTNASQAYGGTWDYEDIGLLRYAVNMGAYVDYGEAAGTSEYVFNENPSVFAFWTYPGNEPYPEIDTFDWACH